MRLRAVVFGFSLLLLMGCTTMQPQDFAGAEPRLVLEDYFRGKTRAWGLFEDRFGNLRRQFVVDIDGTWDGATLTLDEHFVYADGETDRRVWRITKLDDHTYEGRADDVVGVATGEAYGNALNWRYDLDLKVGERTWRVHFDDWMFLQPNGILMNRARVSKFGLTIGTVILAFQNGQEDRSAAAASTANPPLAVHPAPPPGAS